MKKWIVICLGLSLGSGQALAATLNTNEVLLCAPGQYTECTPNGCETVDYAAINAPRFIKIDVKRKRMESLQGGANATSKFDHVERVDGKLILQGVEDGVKNVRDGIGYSIAIVEDTGDMVLSAASEGVSFVAFGACINLP